MQGMTEEAWQRGRRGGGEERGGMAERGEEGVEMDRRKNWVEMSGN